MAVPGRYYCFGCDGWLATYEESKEHAVRHRAEQEASDPVRLRARVEELEAENERLAALLVAVYGLLAEWIERKLWKHS